MANHFISLNRGQQGSIQSDYTTGTSSTAGNDLEIRIADGASLSKKDVIIFCEAIEHFIENNQLVSAAGLVITG